LVFVNIYLFWQKILSQNLDVLYQYFTLVSNPKITMLKIINPYPGFESGFYRPYVEDESSLFFGRDRDISLLKLKVRQKRLVSLISEPKMGKTSLLRAGLIPNLRSFPFDGHNGNEWKCIYMMPEEKPISSLSKALVNPNNKVSDKILPSMEEEVLLQLNKNDYGLVRVAERIIGDRNINLLLVIDDFFDVFQPEVDPKERSKFFKLLHKVYLDTKVPFHIVASFNKQDFKNSKMREDPKLYKALSMGMQKIKFLDQSGLIEAIDSPAKLTNSEVASDLSNEMMLMLLQDNDQLRKLQLLMSRTWMEWKRNHKDKAITKAHYFRATGQKSKAVAKGLMKGGKISVDHLESLAKESAKADNSEMAKADYQKLNEKYKIIFKRIIPHLVDEDSKALKSVSIERKKATELLGISMEELGNLVTEIPTILAMDRKKLSINDISIFEEWDEIKDWIRNNNILKLKFEQIADAAILHYIDGIDLKSVVSRQQYKEMFQYVDLSMVTESWARAQHEQYELGLDFIQKLQETYGVIESSGKQRKTTKKKMTFGAKSKGENSNEKAKVAPADDALENSAESEDAKKEALAILGIVDEEPVESKVQEPLSKTSTEEDDEDEAIRKLLEGDAPKSKETIPKVKEENPPMDVVEQEKPIIEEQKESEKPIIKKEVTKPKVTLKPKAKIVLKGKEDKTEAKPKISLKPKIVIKKK